jgi:thiol-disulfide isomerase/thioredoxin
VLDVLGNGVARHRNLDVTIFYFELKADTIMWCGPCIGEVPNVVATYQKFHGKGFEIVGVSLDEDKQKLLDYTQKQGMTWPQFFDGQVWKNKLAVKYGIEAIPSSFLLDGNGNIIAKDLRGDALEAAVAQATAGN